MKLTEQFISALKQFSAINDHLLIEKGSVIEVRDVDKKIVCSATIDLDIPEEAAIAYVGKFIQTVDLFNLTDVEIEFNEKFLIIKDKHNVCRYTLTKKEFIDTKPKSTWEEYEERILNDPVVIVDVDETMFEHLLKTTRTLNTPHVSVRCKEGSLSFVCADAEQKDSTSFSIALTEDDTLPDFKYTFPSKFISMINKSDFKMKVVKGTPAITLESDSFKFLIPAEKKLSEFIEG